MVLLFHQIDQPIEYPRPMGEVECAARTHWIEEKQVLLLAYQPVVSLFQLLHNLIIFLQLLHAGE